MILSKENYITSSCIIYNNSVLKNGALLFKNDDQRLTDFLQSAYQQVGFRYPKFYKMDNLSKLGWLATEVLLQDDFETGKYTPESIGVVLANANSCLDTDRKYYDSTKDIASPALFVYTLPNIVIGEICIRHNFKGENAFFIFERFDAGFMQQYVSNMINNDILQSCICGWVDVLGDDYKAVLFLVEKKGPVSFTVENINKIYELENG